jgi:hypothetical protein
MISASLGSSASSPAIRACSARLYATTGGHAPDPASKPTLAQPFNKIITAARAEAGCVQHLALHCIVALQCFQPPSGAPSALTRTAKIDNKQCDGEGGKRRPRCPARPRPGEEPGKNDAPHHRVPRFQSSTLAETATAIPTSASVINTQRRVSR